MNAQDGGRREKRVLVVDDCLDATNMMKLLLKFLGYDVRTANSGADALRLAEEFVPHVVLLDLRLPDVPGTEVALALRRNPALSDALVVAISGFSDDGLPAGFDHRLVKPVDIDALVKILSDRTVIGRKAASIEEPGSAIARPDPAPILVRT